MSWYDFIILADSKLLSSVAFPVRSGKPLRCYALREPEPLNVMFPKRFIIT